MKMWSLTCALPLMLAACGAHPSAETPTSDTPVTVTMETALGRIEIELFSERAPITTNNFLAYVDAGHFDGGAFYRTVSPDNDNNPHVINVIQGGIDVGMSPDFSAPLAPIAHETTEASGLAHVDGVISMARGAPGTAQSEFFISIGDNPVLDYGGLRTEDQLGFAAFGRVSNGMSVVRAIHERPAGGEAPDAYVDGQVLSEPVTIVSVARMPPVERR